MTPSPIEQAIKLVDECKFYLEQDMHSTAYNKANEALTALRQYRAGWLPISEAPKGVEVLLYCPYLCASNPERIELGYADNGNGSHHAWATHFRLLPPAPNKENDDG